jgi:hypothetical protein
MFCTLVGRARKAHGNITTIKEPNMTQVVEIERNIKRTTKREADKLGLQKEPFRFYSQEERIHMEVEKKKKKKSSE